MLKKMTASTKNNNRALIYYAAREFVHLSFQDKFNVGYQMGLCDDYDALREETNLEEYIFRKVVNNRELEKFMTEISRIKCESC